VERRPELTSVAIRKSTHRRLRSYVYGQNPRLVMGDVASIAIEEYLDRIARERDPQRVAP